MRVAATAKPAAELAAPPAGFSFGNAQVNGTSLHYVRGGQGPAVILIHGFPEDRVEYRAIMSRLAQRFKVVAVDVPGIGGSAPANGGFDTANLAAHIHGLAEALNLERPYVVGHDLGGYVTYAYVRRFPDALRGVMILDVPMPGLAGADEGVSGLWHIGFIQTPGLTEKMVPGRQDASRLQTFVEGYRAEGMSHVEGEHIPGAGHYVVADNPQAVADLIERYGGR